MRLNPIRQSTSMQIISQLISNNKKWNYFEEKSMIKMLMKMYDKSFNDHIEI